MFLMERGHNLQATETSGTKRVTVSWQCSLLWRNRKQSILDSVIVFNQNCVYLVENKTGGWQDNEILNCDWRYTCWWKKIPTVDLASQVAKGKSSTILGPEEVFKSHVMLFEWWYVFEGRILDHWRAKSLVKRLVSTKGWLAGAYYQR